MSIIGLRVPHLGFDTASTAHAIRCSIKLIYFKLEVIRSLYAGKIERLRDNIALQPPAARQPANGSSSHVVTSSQSCDYEVDSDVQDISVADLIIMQSSFDCK